MNNHWFIVQNYTIYIFHRFHGAFRTCEESQVEKSYTFAKNLKPLTLTRKMDKCLSPHFSFLHQLIDDSRFTSLLVL